MISHSCFSFSLARPDPGTIEYFAKIVSIYSGADKDYEESIGDKLAKLMDVLAVSEEQLLECTDVKSIRSTCRKVVRLVFKQALSDENTPFGSVLREKRMMAAIRGEFTD